MARAVDGPDVAQQAWGLCPLGRLDSHGCLHANTSVCPRDGNSQTAPVTPPSPPQGLFKLAAKTYAARRSLQGSMDGDESFALADVLAAADAGTLADMLAAADGADLTDMLTAVEAAVPAVTKAGSGGSRSGAVLAGAGAGGNGAVAMNGSVAASSSSRSGSGGSKGKARSKAAAARRSSLSVREEIDAW